MTGSPVAAWSPRAASTARRCWREGTSNSRVPTKIPRRCEGGTEKFQRGSSTGVRRRQEPHRVVPAAEQRVRRGFWPQAGEKIHQPRRGRQAAVRLGGDCHEPPPIRASRQPRGHLRGAGFLEADRHGAPGPLEPSQAPQSRPEIAAQQQENGTARRQRLVVARVGKRPPEHAA